MENEASEHLRPFNVLIIDDEENMRHMLATTIARAGYVVETAADGEQGLQKLGTTPFDLILCDIKMPKMDGMSFLAASKTVSVHPTIVMMSAYGTIDLAVEAMKLGAYDFISKPFKGDEILLKIKKVQERQRLQNGNVRLKERIQRLEEHRFGDLLSKSDSMKAVFELAEKVARYDTTVLIIGESGTGKELVAQAIHQRGKRSRSPLVPVNCGGIPENLLESELFGHVKGAFTGADQTKPGLFEEAHRSTIFLDEIGELPLTLQVKLLRVLQESEMRPVGASRAKKVDLRVIAATSRDLIQMVNDGAFREDLYYRLNVLTIKMPPLRDRAEDIPLLCSHFITKFNTSLGRTVRSIAPGAMSGLLQHHWPGNVRELENAIERAMVLSDTEILMPEHFQSPMGQPGNPAATDRAIEGFSLKDAQKVLEQELIIKALKATDGNRTQASRLLQISHPSLLSKIKTYKIDL
jgi:two-component system, NtrC family, response regulator AtoC